MLEIYPAKILEGAGVTDYFIDSEEKTVYLCEGGLEKVAAFFNEKLYQGVSAIDRCGWLYKSPDSLRLNEDSFLV
jgi:preprotein translocase subunit SecA